MPDDAPAPPSEPFALTWLLSGSYRQLRNELHRRMAQAGYPDVRDQHGFAFQVLAGGASGVQLAAHLGVTKQAAHQLIDDLVRRGWARRMPGPDRRTVTVVLTEAGRAVTRAAEQAGAAIEADLARHLGAQRLDRLVDDLRRLDAALAAARTTGGGAIGGGASDGGASDGDDRRAP